jgi:hypothetical protein
LALLTLLSHLSLLTHSYGTPPATGRCNLTLLTLLTLLALLSLASPALHSLLAHLALLTLPQSARASAATAASHRRAAVHEFGRADAIHGPRDNRRLEPGFGNIATGVPGRQDAVQLHAFTASE